MGRLWCELVALAVYTDKHTAGISMWEPDLWEPVNDWVCVLVLKLCVSSACGSFIQWVLSHQATLEEIK